MGLATLCHHYELPNWEHYSTETQISAVRLEEKTVTRQGVNVRAVQYSLFGDVEEAAHERFGQAEYAGGWLWT